MALRTQRFGVRNAAGARSSEWVVIWKTNTSDVYFATHTLGGTMKVSFHESGRCHVRAPRPEYWRGAGEPPEFLLAWDIDPCANYNFPFSVMVPEQELRIAEWAKHKDKRTIWIQAPLGKGVEVAVFFVRSADDLSLSLQSLGRHTHIVDAPLPDGRRLIVTAGESAVPAERLKEVESIKAEARLAIQEASIRPATPRLVLIADANEQGIRKFVEAAILQ